MSNCLVLDLRFKKIPVVATCYLVGVTQPQPVCEFTGVGLDKEGPGSCWLQQISCGEVVNPGTDLSNIEVTVRTPISK